MNNITYGIMFFGAFLALIWGMTLLAPLPRRRRHSGQIGFNRIGPIHPSIQQGTILAAASAAPQSQASSALVNTEWQGEIAQPDGEHHYIGVKFSAGGEAAFQVKNRNQLKDWTWAWTWRQSGNQIQIDGHFENYVGTLSDTRIVSGTRITGTGKSTGVPKTFWLDFYQRY